MLQLFYSFSTAFLQLFYSFSTAFLQLFYREMVRETTIYGKRTPRIRPEQVSLHASYKGILHIVPWTKLADDGGGSTRGKSTGCTPNTVRSGRSKIKPLLSDNIAV